jgi:hypothetical protein
MIRRRIAQRSLVTNSRVIAFIDGDDADRGDLIGEIVQPLLDGRYDLVLASRTRGEREPGAMLWHQVLTGRIAGFGIGALYGVRYSDMCAFSGDQPGRHPAPRDAGDDSRLDHRDADEGRAGGSAQPGGAAAVQAPRWRQLQSGGLIAWYASGRNPRRHNVLSGRCIANNLQSSDRS